MQKSTLSLLLTFLFAILFFNYTFAQYEDGPNMNEARMAHFQVLLANGNVLTLGGHGTGFVALSSAEIFNLNANSFTTYSMNNTHDIGAVVKLSDGKILIAGGAADYGVAPGYKTAEIFDPSDNSFTSINDMAYERTNCYGVTLASGKVLIAGGWYNTNSLTYGEFFDPTTNTFTATGALNTPRANPMVFPTSDSGAVIFGGYEGYSASTYYQSAEYYDPSTNTFSILADSIFTGEEGYYITNVHKVTDEFLMDNGKYIFSAFRRTDADTENVFFTFDPATKSFESIYREPFHDYDEMHQVGFVLDKNANVLYTVWYKITTTIQIGVSYLDLTSKQMVMPSTWYDLPAGYYPTYSCLSLLSNNKILMTGGYSNPSITNFSPIDKTIFITLSTTDVQIDNPAIPDKWELLQNYPNPFNPSTVIKYQVKQAGQVKLDVFNLLGQHVKSLVNEQQSAGSYNVTFEANGLPSGIYLYRLQTNDFVKIRKMILLK